MRFPAVLFAALLTMSPAYGDDLFGRDWQLLAVDGVMVDFAATLKLEADGAVSGKAPCNSSWPAHHVYPFLLSSQPS